MLCIHVIEMLPGEFLLACFGIVRLLHKHINIKANISKNLFCKIKKRKLSVDCIAAVGSKQVVVVHVQKRLAFK